MAASAPTLSRDEVLALALAGEDNFMPVVEETRLTQHPKFLFLAPTTSASYPSSSSSKSAGPAPTLPLPQAPKESGLEATEMTTSALPITTPEVLDAELLKTSRSSSSGSDGSAGGSPMQRKRFLKLGPVHGGGDGKGDWSEDVIAE
jgi:hypothetical protein